MSKKLIVGASVVASFAVALAPLATFADVAANPSDQHTDQLVVTVLPSCTFGSAIKSEANGDAAHYPSGITHDDSTGDYASDMGTNGTKSATAWDDGEAGTDYTSDDTAGALHGGNGNTTNHNENNVQSSGYGILNGEGGVVDDGTNLAQTAAHKKNASQHTVHRSMLAGTETENFAETTMYIVCNNGGGYTVKATATALENGDATPLAINPVAVNGYSTTQSGYNGIVTTNDTTDAPTNLANIVSTSETVIASKSGITKEAGDSITVTYGMGIASSQKADTYAGTVTYKLYKGVNGANNG